MVFLCGEMDGWSNVSTSRISLVCMEPVGMSFDIMYVNYEINGTSLSTHRYQVSCESCKDDYHELNNLTGSQNARNRNIGGNS